MELNQYGRPQEDEHDPRGLNYFEGSYALQAPGFFALSDEQLLEFSFDTDGAITFTPASQALLDEHGVQTRVGFETLHADDPSNQLGPLGKVTLSWENDASPELYAFGLFKQGGVYRQSVPGMALAWAFVVSNDGEAGLWPDRGAELIRFTPGS